MRLASVRILPFLRYIKEEAVIVLGTSSTQPVLLPRMMANSTRGRLEAGRRCITVPAGDLDPRHPGIRHLPDHGSVFLAQALGIDLSLTQQLSMLIMLLTSKGVPASPAPDSSPSPPPSAPSRTFRSPPSP